MFLIVTIQLGFWGIFLFVLFFGMQSSNLCLLIGLFKPFTLTVTVDMIKSIILLFVSYLSHLFLVPFSLYFCLNWDLLNIFMVPFISIANLLAVTSVVALEFTECIFDVSSCSFNNTPLHVYSKNLKIVYFIPLLLTSFLLSSILFCITIC